jgi:hypothetical protein
MQFRRTALSDSIACERIKTPSLVKSLESPPRGGKLATLGLVKKFNVEQGTAFLRDRFVHFKDAGLNIASSPVLYGLAVYTVFSVNWNESGRALYAFRFKDHYARLVNATRLMGFTGADGKAFAADWPYERFESTMLELIRKNKIREDALVRVSVFVDGIIAGTKISGLPIALSAFVYPLGQILRPDGIRVCVSSWRHIPDDVIPNRAKVNGAYVSNCLMKNEASSERLRRCHRPGPSWSCDREHGGKSIPRAERKADHAFGEFRHPRRHYARYSFAPGGGFGYSG